MQGPGVQVPVVSEVKLSHERPWRPFQSAQMRFENVRHVPQIINTYLIYCRWAMSTYDWNIFQHDLHDFLYITSHKPFISHCCEARRPARTWGSWEMSELRATCKLPLSDLPNVRKDASNMNIWQDILGRIPSCVSWRVLTYVLGFVSNWQSIAWHGALVGQHMLAPSCALIHVEKALASGRRGEVFRLLT